MRILKQLIEKKLENERILLKNKQNILSYQEHLSAYLLSLSFLSIKDNKINKKIMLWNRFIETENKDYFLKLMRYKQEENYIILMALKETDILEEEKSEIWGSLFDPYCWAILSYEHEEGVS